MNDDLQWNRDAEIIDYYFEHDYRQYKPFANTKALKNTACNNRILMLI